MADTNPTSSLRVTRLEARDFKRIEALDVSPGRKSLIILRGPNEAGKTSAIDSLIATIGGKGRSPEVPVRRGAEDAAVTVELSDALRPRYQVTRSWTTEGRTWLTVKTVNDDGTTAKLTAGQTLLDSLVSDVSFDPLAFAKADRKEQVRLLYAAVGKLADYEAAQLRRKGLYDKRTEVNGRGRRAEAELAACPDPCPGQTLQPVSDAELAKQLADAQAHNNKRDDLLRRATQRRNDAQLKRNDAAEIAAKIAELQADLARAQKEAVELDVLAGVLLADLEKLPPAVDTAAITAHVQQVRQANARAEQQAAHRAKRQAAEQARHGSAGLTAQIEAVDRDLDRMLETSGIGQAVPGLAVRNGEVQHNGLPLSQASGMRRLETSCLVGMAASPSLRVLCVDEGDQLDDASIARLIELAQARDYAVWMTAIRAGDPSNPETHVVDIAAGKAVQPCSAGSVAAGAAPCDLDL
ncbi:MAG: AAA family ATPase [Planctomycetes bacterium]|nr:AAA family ATPase [Planctomycetota bacterium]